QRRTAAGRTRRGVHPIAFCGLLSASPVPDLERLSTRAAVRAALLLLPVLLAAQEPASPPAPPAPGKTAVPATAARELPDLGPPAAAPDGAPKQLELIERNLLRQHAYWLADDQRQGRFTSSRTQLETAKYVAAQFQKLGLKPLGD